MVALFGDARNAATFSFASTGSLGSLSLGSLTTAGLSTGLLAASPAGLPVARSAVPPGSSPSPSASSMSGFRPAASQLGGVDEAPAVGLARLGDLLPQVLERYGILETPETNRPDLALGRRRVG